MSKLLKISKPYFLKRYKKEIRKVIKSRGKRMEVVTYYYGKRILYKEVLHIDLLTKIPVARSYYLSLPTLEIIKKDLK